MTARAVERGADRIGVILAENPLFGGLPEDARALVEERLEGIRVDSGEWLMRKGDPGDALFLVETGRLAVVRGERPDGTI